MRMNSTDRVKSESFDEYTLRMIESRSDNGFEYDELYELLLGEEYSVSVTEARKRLSGIKNFLTKKQTDTNDEVGKEIERLSEKESFEIKADGSHVLEKFVLACEEDRKSPSRIMEILGYDPLEWELTGSKTSRWNVSNGTGNPNHKVLYSLKCTVRPRKVKLSTTKIEDVINNLSLNIKGLKEYDYSEGDFMYEIPMMDVHFNKISDERIVGVLNNAETTEKDYISAVKYFLNKVKNMDIKLIVFPIGQDAYNSEMGGKTTGGTPQDNDLPDDLMFEKGTDMFFQAIELCRMVAPVLVQYVAGNHSANLAYHTVSSLKRAYSLANIQSVEFDILPKRKYVEFGKCLIGYTHSNKERNRIEKQNIMQNEQKEAWGRTVFREWHFGHEHHEEVSEIGNIKYRKISTITATDRWHYDSGFIGSLRMAQAFLWHKDMGLLDIYNCPII